MRRRRALLALASCSPLAAPGLLRAQGAPAVMRLSHQFPPAHHNARVLAAFAEDVKARSNASVEVQVFPAEQLARAAENFPGVARGAFEADRKSTRLNSSHANISYAVFCLKKKK